MVIKTKIIKQTWHKHLCQLQPQEFPNTTAQPLCACEPGRKSLVPSKSSRLTLTPNHNNLQQLGSSVVLGKHIAQRYLPVGLADLGTGQS